MPAIHELNVPITLSDQLLAAVRAQDFAATVDHWQHGAAVGQHPSIDLAVVAFTPGAAPCWANVLFSREHPQGFAAPIAPDAAALRTVRFESDLQDAQGASMAWLPGANWQAWGGRALHAQHAAGAPRFIAPYPASLLKLMVAVGVGLAVDHGDCAWPDALEPMLVVSSNEATDDCVALLHRTGWLGAESASAASNPAPEAKWLNACFTAWGLPTLQLNNTTARGGWRNGDGAGVGHIHMTAWDTVRLLWLLDTTAPPAPWLAPALQNRPLLQAATRRRLLAVLARQQLDEVLSSGALRGEPGWVPGLPDAPAFAHKTGTTDNYAADAGIVHSAGTHYLVAVLSSLGRRYAASAGCATTWRLPALGAAVHRIITEGVG